MEEKIGSKICSLRKKAGITQRQLAEALGVSEPAVCKWETGSTMPDICLLIPIARFLNTDLNDLMSYHAELTESEVDKILDEGRMIGKEQGSVDEIRYLRKKVCEYPNSEWLKAKYAIEIIEIAERLEKQLPEIYTESLKQAIEILKDLSSSKEERIHIMADVYLAHQFMKERRFDEAEKYINRIPVSDYNAKNLRPVLCFAREDYDECLKLSEKYLMQNMQNVLICLQRMSEVKRKQGENEASLQFAEGMLRLSEEFQIPFYRGSTAMLDYYMEMKDYDHAMEWFVQYTEDIIQMSKKLNESIYFKEIRPELEVISNGKEVGLSALQKAMWKTIQKEDYLKPIRNRSDFIQCYDKLRDYFSDL